MAEAFENCRGAISQSLSILGSLEASCQRPYPASFALMYLLRNIDEFLVTQDWPQTGFDLPRSALMMVGKFIHANTKPNHANALCCLHGATGGGICVGGGAGCA